MTNSVLAILILINVNLFGFQGISINKIEDEARYYCAKYSIRTYLDRYNHISDEDKDKYSKLIIKTSKRFEISPFILASIVDIESTFRENPTHQKITVRVPLNRSSTKTEVINTRAVGMTGIVYEIWKYELDDYNITKDDLSLPKYSIMGSAIILNYKINQRKIGNYSRLESGLLRYYGLTGSPPSTIYLKKVKKRLKKLKKIEKNCKLNYRIGDIYEASVLASEGR